MTAQGGEGADVDPVTGLPTLAALHERVERALARSRRGGPAAAVALLFVRLGSLLPDGALVAAAARIAGVLRPGDTLVRVDDGFAVLCERLARPGDAAVIAHRVDAALAPPVEVDHAAVDLGATIEISHVDPADTDPFASTAARLVLDDELRTRVGERGRMLAALHSARDGTDLAVQYQPVVSLDTGRISGVEALLRWHHDGRLVPPSEFVPLAEEAGLVAELGAWVLRRAAAQVSQWQRMPGRSGLRLAVNVSAQQLHAPDLVDTVAEVAAQVLAPDTLWLELTESLLIEELAELDGTIEQLVGTGARLALDDFGTGYSSLGYLRRLPVDAVKLDRSFVAGVGSDPEDTAIVTAVLDLVAVLGKECVAEGVESLEQHEWLRARGCASGQGFFYSRPLDADALGALLRSERR